MPSLSSSSSSRFLSARVVLALALGVSMAGCSKGTLTSGTTAPVTPPVTPQATPGFDHTGYVVQAPVGSANNGFVMVTNTSTSAISLVNPVAFTGTNAADFTQVNTQSNALAQPCPASLAAGASCRIIYTFKPSSTVANTSETATLQLTSGAALNTLNPLPVSGLVTAGVDVTKLAGCTLTSQTGCLAAMQSAINTAVTFYKGCAGGTGTGGNYTIVVPAGSFDLSAQPQAGNLGQVDFSGVWACNGNFAFSGAGAALTSIYTNNSAKTMGANTVNNLTIEGISFLRNDQTGLNGFSMSAGTYVSDTTVAGRDVVTLNILPGYPSPADVFNAYGTQSAYFKAYDNTNITDPLIDPSIPNPQLPFDSVVPACTTINGVVQCQLTLGKGSVITPSLYTKPNEIACLKMESSQFALLNDLGSQLQGNNVGFTDVYWYDSGRLAFRGLNHPFVTWSALKRRAPIPAMNGQYGCFAVWAGGPQFGQPSDPLMTGILFDHFVSEGAADETTEIFNEDPNEPAGGSVVSNLTMHNGFGDFVALDNACGITFDYTSGTHGTPLSQTLTKCPAYLEDTTPPTYKLPTVNGQPTYGGCVVFYKGTVDCSINGVLPNANK